MSPIHTTAPGVDRGDNPAPPAGAVTLLFTDIEGSTRLARRLGGEWSRVISDHHRLLGSAIAEQSGYVERPAGDSFFALFTDPVLAVKAAVDAQRSLDRHRWPHAGGRPRVRMGLHSGHVERTERGLIGLDIHLVARVEAAAHGDQIVITQATRDAVPGRFAIEELGLYRLKDFPVPERLFQVIVDGRGPAAFPPARAAAVRPISRASRVGGGQLPRRRCEAVRGAPGHGAGHQNRAH